MLLNHHIYIDCQNHWFINLSVLQTCSYTCHVHVQCCLHFFLRVKFSFRFRQLIAFLVCVQLCCRNQSEESLTTFQVIYNIPFNVTCVHFEVVFRLKVVFIHFLRLHSFLRFSSFLKLSLFLYLSSFLRLSSFFR